MKNKTGFTLLELLVVVLIIGILAAIALPQYQIAVGKAKFSTLKNVTKSILESTQRYYMVTGNYPHKTSDLDINLNIKREEYTTNAYLEFSTNNDFYCYIWDKNQNHSVACGRTILKKDMRFYIRRNGSPQLCAVSGKTTNNIANKICQNETGKTEAICGDKFCSYQY